MTIQTIAIENLKISPLNVRKSKRNNIKSLSEDIAAHGLLQNLVGYQEGKKYCIAAGGRRLEALRLLKKAERLPKNFKVPVEVKDKDIAIEVSLAENSAREDMHPADAIDAYRALIEDDKTPEAIATRFGVSIAHVKRILKLAGLHEDIKAAFARDEIGISAAQAYTLTEDQALQVELFEQYGNCDWQVRSALTNEKIKTNNGLFQIVSLDDYRAAGGTITCDLFDTEGQGYADNPEILLDLIETRMAEIEEELKAEGWQTVERMSSRPDNFYMLNHMEPEGRKDPSKKQLTLIETLEAEQRCIVEDDPEAEHWNNDDLRDIDRKLRSIDAGLLYFTAEQKEHGKMLLFIDNSGKLVQQPIDLRKKNSATAKSDAPKPDYSAKLVTDLQRIKTLAVREAVAGDGALALDIMLFTLARQIMCSGYASDFPVNIAASDRDMTVEESLMTQSDITAVEILAAPVFAKLNPETLLEDICVMDAQDKSSLLALLVAHQIQDSNLGWGDSTAQLDRIGQAASVDMKKAWQPSVGFFERLTKPVMLKILDEQCGEGAAENCKNMKKTKLAAEMSERLAGRDWLPEPVCFKSCDD